MSMIVASVGEMVRVFSPGPLSSNVLRMGAEIKSGTNKAIERSSLPAEDRARLEILEATPGVEIVNIIVTKDNKLKTVDISLTSALTKALVSMSQKGLQRPSVYNDGYVIQLNF